jgi:prepilin-type N-terminal cleavage/methylation domain-containing protein
MRTRPSDGFVLIELVTTLVLVGVIGAFAGLFLWNGINGYLASKRNSEAALKAQVALDRMSAELRHIESIQGAPVQTPNSNPSITYRSRDFGAADRRISYDSSNQNIILRVNNSDYILLDSVESFSLIVDANNNLDGSSDGSKEVSAIKIDFKIIGVGALFNTRIYPRNFITKTWS